MKKMMFAAALFAATAAQAQVQTQAQAQVQAGFRADVHAGWDRASAHQRTDVGTSGATTRQRDDGIVYGLELGYDLAIGKAILGSYAGIEGSTARKCSAVFAEVETCAKSGRNWTVGTRAGYAVTDGVLLYAKGGYSNGQARISYVDHVTPANSFGFSENRGGFHVGAGAQVALTSNVYAKADYVRTDYQDYRIKEGTATISGGIDRDNVTVGFGVRF